MASKIFSINRSALGHCLALVLIVANSSSCMAQLQVKRRNESTQGESQRSVVPQKIMPQLRHMWLSLPTADPTLDSNSTVGFETCAKCHKSEAAVWKSTWHHTSFRSLHRSEQAQAIANRLGLASVKYSQRCIKCHYTETNVNGDVTIDSAVSCECCHGAAKNWYNTHFPPKETTTESELEKSVRIIRNVSNGMRNRHNTFTMARKCMRCHNVADEELVNIGGHSIGDPSFEMVAWSQGLMRHRFVSGNLKGNAPNSPERLSVMFVSGMIADLEFSLRATAEATATAEYGKRVAQRSARSAKRLAAVRDKVSSPILDDILDIYDARQLKINNRENLLGMAERIRILGVRFAAETDPKQLKAILKYVPGENDWRWQ